MKCQTKTKIKRLLWILILLSAFTVISSCSIEKRLHSKGWNIQWHKQYSPKSQLAENTEIVRSVPIQDSSSLIHRSKTVIETIAIRMENPEKIKLSEQNGAVLVQKIVLNHYKKSHHPRQLVTPIKKSIEQVNYVDNRWIGFLAISLVSLLVGILLIVFLNPSAMLAYQLMAIIVGGLLIISGLIFLVISFIFLGVKTSQNSTSVNNSEPSANKDKPIVEHHKIEPETRSKSNKPQNKKGGLLILLGFLTAAILVFFLIN